MKRAIKDLGTVQWENPEIRYNPKFDNPQHQQAVGLSILVKTCKTCKTCPRLTYFLYSCSSLLHAFNYYSQPEYKNLAVNLVFTT